jgi:hypothetical protein
MDVQTLLILPVILLAVLYVGRKLLPRKRGDSCDSCSAERQKPRDYV